MRKGLERGRVLARRATNRLAARPLILMYHRVAELPADPQLLAVSPRHFAEQLAVLRRMLRPMPLRQLSALLAGGKLPRHAVVLTFDDGYADNLHHARPLLERHDVPATVFVTAGHVGGRREFWWDELERLLLQPGVLPSRLSLQLSAGLVHWSLDGSAELSEACWQASRDWHVERAEDPTPRHTLYRELHAALHDQPPDARQAALDALRQWAGMGADGRPSHAVLTAQETRSLGADGLVEIGAHTMTHPALSRLWASEQAEEVRLSRAVLEDISGRRVTSMAYPHGAASLLTERIVRDAGYRQACSSEAGTVRRNSDLFRLPRFVVRDWDGDTFERCLRGWLGE